MYYHYYILRIRDEYLRIGLQANPTEALDPCGSIDEGLEFIRTLIPPNTYPGLGFSLDIPPEYYFCGTFFYPIKADVDQWMGLGDKPYGEQKVVTCKHLYQMRSKKKTTVAFLDNLKKIHKLVYNRQLEIYERMQEV